MPIDLTKKNRTFAHTIVGVGIRGSIKNVKPDETDPEKQKTTFRIMPGNGFFGTVRGVKYQQKYRYTVSDPNCNHTGPTNKARMASAMAAWNILSPTQKQKWNIRADQSYPGWWGHNLFVREYMRNNP